MKKSVLTFAATLFFSAFTISSVSADNNDNNEASHSVSITIPTVALVDVESTSGEAGTINLTPDISSLEAGSAVDFTTATNSDLWLNYTSVVEGGQGNNTNERDITVMIDDEDNLPEGINILVSAGSISTGKGKKGKAVSGAITLGEEAKNIVTGIGSCYTESGYQKGHQLTYSLSIDNDSYEDLLADSYEVEITYTITGD